MTGGGNIGDLLTNDAEASVLVLRRDPRESEAEGPWLTGVSAETGAVLWDLRTADHSYLSARALSVGGDLWIRDGSELEWRAAATGVVHWSREIPWSGALVSSEAALHAEGRIDRAGSQPAVLRSSWNSTLCVIAERVVTSDFMHPASMRAPPTQVELTQRAVDGTTETVSLPLTALEAEARSLRLDAGVCGRSPTVDVVTFDVFGAAGQSTTRVWGFDPATRKVAWTIDLGSDRLVPHPSAVRPAHGAGRLSRYVGVVIQTPQAPPPDAGLSEDDYRLTMLDLERGRIAWSLPLVKRSKRSPRVVATDRYQFVVADGPLHRLLVFDMGSGELVKAIDLGTQNLFVRARQITDTMIWVGTADHHAAYGYTLPDLVSPNPQAPRLRDVTAEVRAGIARSP
jgi:hypothetical protein